MKVITKEKCAQNAAAFALTNRALYEECFGPKSTKHSKRQLIALADAACTFAAVVAVYSAAIKDEELDDSIQDIIKNCAYEGRTMMTVYKNLGGAGRPMSYSNRVKVFSAIIGTMLPSLDNQPKGTEP